MDVWLMDVQSSVPKQCGVIENGLVKAIMDRAVEARI